jgi:uncharacterized membrane protein YdjX (TVP38/TMEM64 family)
VKKRLIFLFIFLAVAVLAYDWAEDFLSFENVQQNKEILKKWVDENYALAVFLFVAVHIPTSFFIPGEILLVLLGGFLFGVIPGTLYIDLGITLGALLAFLTARYLLGEWVQNRYREQLESFNAEISRHGHNYLLTFRIVPLIPFFVVNYLAGISNIPAKTFVLTTSLGVLPGALCLTYVGSRLGSVQRPEDIFSGELYLALSILGLFAFMPVLTSYWKSFKRRRRAP